MGHNIKRSVTIYSWHRQVEAGKLTWEEMIWKYGTKTIAHDFFEKRGLLLGNQLELQGYL